ncbi:MAG TPA: acyl-CoA dehydrogenase family protein, partial [Cellvibrio sp.]
MIKWTEDQIELRNSIGEWATKLNDDFDGQNDRATLLKMWKLVREMGVLSLPIKKEYGGLEQDVLT